MVHFDARCCRVAQISALRRIRPQIYCQRQHPRLRHFTGRATRPITAFCGTLRRNAPTNVASSRMVGLVLRKPSNASSDGADGFDGSVATGPTQNILSAERPVVVLPARYVLLSLANALTGYSVKAMERKIERGDWQEGKVWKRAPDGRVMIDMAGYQRWVENR